MLQLEGMSTAKIALFHQGSTEPRRCENCVFFLPVNTLAGVTRRLLEPHDTLPYVLICDHSKFPSLMSHNLSCVNHCLNQDTLPCVVQPKKPARNTREYIDFFPPGSMDCPCLPPPAHKWPVLDKPGLS